MLLPALACLARRRSDIFLADGGSCPSFREALTGLPITVVPVDERGLVAQVRAALGAAAASGARRVLYTEPDKHEFFDRHLAAFLDTAGAAGEPVALAARSAAAFETFPPFQRFTESIFNRLCAEFIAGPTDFFVRSIPRRLKPGRDSDAGRRRARLGMAALCLRDRAPARARHRLDRRRLRVPAGSTSGSRAAPSLTTAAAERRRPRRRVRRATVNPDGDFDSTARYRRYRRRVRSLIKDAEP